MPEMPNLRLSPLELVWSGGRRRYEGTYVLLFRRVFLRLPSFECCQQQLLPAVSFGQQQ